MIRQNEESMLPVSQEFSDKFEEIWRVVLQNGAEYELGKIQALILKQEITNGNRGIVMFETFAISIPYIIEFYRVRKFLRDTKQLSAKASELPYKPIPKEKWEKIKKEAYRTIGKIYA